MDYTETIGKYQGSGLCLKLVLETVLKIFKSGSVKVNARRSVLLYMTQLSYLFSYI